jgi:chemotaxis protein methyltransferase CheR
MRTRSCSDGQKKQDIRETALTGRFHLILCRNLVFTYFDLESQRKILKMFHDHLEPGGALVIGGHEQLPLSAETSPTP